MNNCGSIHNNFHRYFLYFGSKESHFQTLADSDDDFKTMNG